MDLRKAASRASSSASISASTIGSSESKKVTALYANESALKAFVSFAVGGTLSQGSSTSRSCGSTGSPYCPPNTSGEGAPAKNDEPLVARPRTACPGLRRDSPAGQQQ